MNKHISKFEGFLNESSEDPQYIYEEYSEKINNILVKISKTSLDEINNSSFSDEMNEILELLELYKQNFPDDTQIQHLYGMCYDHCATINKLERLVSEASDMKDEIW